MAAGRLDDEHPLLDAAVGQHAPDDAGRDHEVVARSVAERPELAFEHAGAFVHEDHFVAVRVPVPVAHRLGWAARSRCVTSWLPISGDAALHGVAAAGRDASVRSRRCRTGPCSA